MFLTAEMKTELQHIPVSFREHEYSTQIKMTDYSGVGA